MPTESEIEKQAKHAVDMFLRGVSYPVIWTDGDRIETLGTAVPFQHGDRHFLLTARHLFDEFDERTHTEFPYDGLVGPANFTPPSVRKFGQIFVHHTKGAEAEFLDILAIELLDDSFVQTVKRFWRFINIDLFALPDLDAPYFVAGFPKVRERQIGGNIGAAFMSLQTHRMETVPDEVKNYNAQYDLILKYDKQAADRYLGNKQVDTPFVGGVSGGPIFRRADEPPGFWAPASGIRFVGLQASSIKTNEWLRVKNMQAIHRYFAQAIPPIGSAIKKQLGL